MKTFLELFPIALFFITSKTANYLQAGENGIYYATAAGMLGACLQIAWHAWRKKPMTFMAKLASRLMLVLGTVTLLLHNKAFIMWKPSILYWGFALAILIARFALGKAPIKAVLGHAIAVNDAIWRQLDIVWALFFFALGCANLWVVTHLSENAWVDFKTFGMFGLTIVFAMLQMLFLYKHLTLPDGSSLPKDASATENTVAHPHTTANSSEESRH